MGKNKQIDCRRVGIISLHNLALWSVVFYIILSTIFEESKTGMARYASLGILVCIGMCTLSVLVNRRFRVDWWIAQLFIFGLVLSISTLYSPSTIAIKNTYLYRYWTSLILVLLISNVLQDKKEIVIIIHGFIYAGVLLALYVYAFYGIRSLSSSSMRLTNEIANQNSIGINCAISFILSVVEITQTRRNKIFYFIMMLITLPVCMFSGSRKSVLLILIGVFSYFVLFSENKQIVKQLLTGGIIIVGIVVAIQYVPAFSVINDRFDQLFALTGKGGVTLNAGDVNRMYFVNMGFEAFKASPLWGNGFVYSYSLFNTYSHNNYIELLMNNGIIGFLMYYMVHYRILRLGIKLRDKSKSDSALIIMIIIMILFIDLGTVNYYVRSILILLCLAAKLVSSVYNIEGIGAGAEFNEA